MKLTKKQEKAMVAKCVDVTLAFQESFKKHEASGLDSEKASEKAFDEVRETCGISEGELAFAISTGFAFAEKLQSLDLKPND